MPPDGQPYQAAPAPQAAPALQAAQQPFAPGAPNAMVAQPVAATPTDGKGFSTMTIVVVGVVSLALGALVAIGWWLLF